MTKTDAWKEFADYAADTAIVILRGIGKPENAIDMLKELLRMHQKLRPEQYAPKTHDDEPDYYGEIIEPPEGRH